MSARSSTRRVGNPRPGLARLLIDTKLSGALLIVVLLLLWELAFQARWVTSVGLSPPSQVAQALVRLTLDGTLPLQVLHSLRRMVMGYGAAVVVGVSVGVLMGFFQPIYNLLEPITESLRPIPSPAYIPIVILFLGFGEEMKVFMIGFSCLWSILLNTFSGVRAVDPVQIGTARTFGYGNWQIIRKVTLPAAAPYIVTGMRVSLGVALIVMVIAEMVAANDGIGFFILDAQRTYQVKEMYAGVVVLGLMGYLLNRLFVTAERHFMAWHYGATGREH